MDVPIKCKSKITCGRIVILQRTSCRPTPVVAISSMEIDPSAGSINLNRACVKEDFPAPVLPTIPICNLNEYNLALEGTSFLQKLAN